MRQAIRLTSSEIPDDFAPENNSKIQHLFQGNQGKLHTSQIKSKHFLKPFYYLLNEKTHYSFIQNNHLISPSSITHNRVS